MQERLQAMGDSAGARATGFYYVLLLLPLPLPHASPLVG